MEFRRLVSAQDSLFAEAFALYEVGFPMHERRPLDKQAALMPNPRYHFDVIVENGAAAGILLYWDGSGYAYIEHFAIQPAMRGRAIGSEVLKMFCKAHSSVVLEIDPPVDETAIRRQRFYLRLGFKTTHYAHRHPGYQPQALPHELVVMSYPKAMAKDAYQLFRRELEGVVMEDYPLTAIQNISNIPPPIEE